METDEALIGGALQRYVAHQNACIHAGCEACHQEVGELRAALRVAGFDIVRRSAAPSPATVDVGEARKLADNLAREMVGVGAALGGAVPPDRDRDADMLMARAADMLRSIASALAASEKKVARLEGRMCLVCGAPEPCKDAPDACTFDPSPIDAARAFLDRATAAEALARDAGRHLTTFVEAFDRGHVQLASEEIPGEPGTGFDDPNGPSLGYPPHPWHEEWLVYARAALAQLRPVTTEGK